MRSILVFALLLMLSGCVSQPDFANQCTEPRPQVCTMEYAPTCAALAAGGSKEFSSPCTACSDDAVLGYNTGPCPE